MSTRAKVPRSDDPLGMGLTTVPESLKRLYLIWEGNPYWEEAVEEVRAQLGIPAAGFTDLAHYSEWYSRFLKGHGHDFSFPGFFIEYKGQRVTDSATLGGHLNLGPPPGLEDYYPSSPCCESDPRYYHAQELAHRFGIESAAAEPGFERLLDDVVQNIVVGTWVRHRSERGRKVTYESDVLAYTPTPRRVMGRRTVIDEGEPVKGGGGGALPRWLEWWRIRQAKSDWKDVVGEIDQQLESQGVQYDDSTIRQGISEVERLMKPTEN